jgi:hypothetical protein
MSSAFSNSNSRRVNTGIRQEADRNADLYGRYIQDIGGSRYAKPPGGTPTTTTTPGRAPSGRATDPYPRTDYEVGADTPWEPPTYGGDGPGVQFGAPTTPGGSPESESRLDRARRLADSSYADIYGRYTDLFNRGFGMDPEAKSAYSRLASGSDVDPNKFRANGTYEEFNRTGGLSESDRADIRSRATSTIPSMFQALSAKLGQQNNIAGAASPGYTSQVQSMARDQARGISDADLNASLGITKQVNEGRQWGATGMTGAEAAYTAALARSLGMGAEGLQSGLETGRAQEQSALTGLRGLRTDVPGELALYERLMAEVLRDRASTQQGALKLDASYNPRSDRLGQASQIMGMLGPLLSMFGGGGAPTSNDSPSGFAPDGTWLGYPNEPAGPPGSDISTPESYNGYGMGY